MFHSLTWFLDTLPKGNRFIEYTECISAEKSLVRLKDLISLMYMHQPSILGAFYCSTSIEEIVLLLAKLMGFLFMLSPFIRVKYNQESKKRERERVMTMRQSIALQRNKGGSITEWLSSHRKSVATNFIWSLQALSGHGDDDIRFSHIAQHFKKMSFATIQADQSFVDMDVWVCLWLCCLHIAQ